MPGNSVMAYQLKAKKIKQSNMLFTGLVNVPTGNKFVYTRLLDAFGGNSIGIKCLEKEEDICEAWDLLKEEAEDGTLVMERMLPECRTNLENKEMFTAVQVIIFYTRKIKFNNYFNISSTS